MLQVFATTHTTAWNTGAARYTSLIGGYMDAGATTPYASLMSCAGKIQKVRITLSVAPGAGKSWVITLMKNGVAQSVEVTISEGATTGTDSSNTCTVAAGDYLAWRVVPSGTPAATKGSIGCQFQGTVAKESNVLGAGITNTGATSYLSFGAGYSYAAVTSINYGRAYCGAAGTLSKLYVRLSADPGTAGSDAYTFTLYKNGIITDITCTITANDIIGSDLTNSVAIVEGDYLHLHMIPVSTPSVSPQVSVSLKLTATTDGESLIFNGATGDAYTNNATEYNQIQVSTSSDSWGITEATHYMYVPKCTLSKMYVYLPGAAPGAGNSTTVSVRKNGADPANTLTVTISEANQTGSDLTHSVVCVNDDYINFKNIPVSDPVASVILVGMKMVVAGAWANITKINGSPSVDINKVDGINLESVSKIDGVPV